MIPTTNPTSTAIFKALLALKTRNGIIISPHPRAKGCTVAAARLVLEAAVAAGAPEGIVGMDRRAQPGAHRPADGGGGPDPGHRRTRHGEGGLFLRQARSWAWALATSPPSSTTPPMWPLAVNSVIHSKTFDNGMICASEQSVIVLDTIYDQVKAEFAARGCYFLKGEEIGQGPKDHPHQRLPERPRSWARAPTRIGEAGGHSDVLRPPRSSSARWTAWSLSEEFAHEKLSPVLAMYRAKDFDDALDKADRLVADGGYGHTASIYLNAVTQREKLDALRPADEDLPHPGEHPLLPRRHRRPVQLQAGPIPDSGLRLLGRQLRVARTWASSIC